jgi:hypothetical protein
VDRADRSDAERILRLRRRRTIRAYRRAMALRGAIRLDIDLNASRERNNH